MHYKRLLKKVLIMFQLDALNILRHLISLIILWDTWINTIIQMKYYTILNLSNCF